MGTKANEVEDESKGIKVSHKATKANSGVPETIKGLCSSWAYFNSFV